MSIKSFRERIAATLSENDVAEFKDIFKEKLNELFKQSQKELLMTLTEANDLEMKMATTVQAAAKSFGGYDGNYDQGVLEISVPGKEASLHFADYLDKNEDVDSYDVEPVEGSKGSFVDLEDDAGESDIDYLFTIFFVTDNVNFEPEEIEESCKSDDDEDEDDEDDEIKESRFDGISSRTWLTEAKKIVTFRGGVKKIKMQCPPGQKWNSAEGKCVIMNAAENRKRHLSGLVASKKRMSKMGVILKKRAKSLAKRIAAGF